MVDGSGAQVLEPPLCFRSLNHISTSPESGFNLAGTEQPWKALLFDLALLKKSSMLAALRNHIIFEFGRGELMDTWLLVFCPAFDGNPK